MRMRQLRIEKSITVRDSASLDKYLTEIGKEPLISIEEEVELAQRIKMGDSSAMEKLTKANLRFVVSVAKQYQNQGLSLPDLINEGNLGLIKAAGRFDETRGFKFISYGVWWIRQAILQAIAEQSKIVHIPLNKSGRANKIKKVIEKFMQEHERKPSNFEIAEILEIREDDVADSIVSSQRHLSLDSPFMEGEDNCLLDVIYDEEAPIADDRSHNESLSIEIERSFSRLSEKEADILMMFYGIGCEELSLEEIGEHFGLTRERIRQIKEKAIRRLRNPHRGGNLVQFLG